MSPSEDVEIDYAGHSDFEHPNSSDGSNHGTDILGRGDPQMKPIRIPTADDIVHPEEGTRDFIRSLPAFLERQDTIARPESLSPTTRPAISLPHDRRGHNEGEVRPVQSRDRSTHFRHVGAQFVPNNGSSTVLASDRDAHSEQLTNHKRYMYAARKATKDDLDSLGLYEILAGAGTPSWGALSAGWLDQAVTLSEKQREQEAEAQRQHEEELKAQGQLEEIMKAQKLQAEVEKKAQETAANCSWWKKPSESHSEQIDADTTEQSSRGESNIELEYRKASLLRHVASGRVHKSRKIRPHKSQSGSPQGSNPSPPRPTSSG